MPKPLFPPEILEFSTENYYSKLSTRSRIIYLSVLLSVVAAIASLPFIRVDVSTQCRGIVRSPSENTIVQSSVYGEVICFDMHENKYVHAGDTLMRIDTGQIEEKIGLEWKKKSDNDRFILDINLLLNESTGLTTPKYRTEYGKYRSGVQENEIRINFLKREFDIAQDLYDRSVISRSEYLKEKNNLDLATSSFEHFLEEYKTSWQNERTRLVMENQNIESYIRQLEKEKNNYVFVAPSSGTLVQVTGLGRGNFIVPNQMIAHISNSDSLLIECYLSPFDIGYIKENQGVVCLVDAFDYRHWGMLEGNVTEILTDVVELEEMPAFRVRCKMNSNCLQLKNGYEGCLKKGMTLTCRFHLTRRSLWQLLFDKLDNWMNPKLLTD